MSKLKYEKDYHDWWYSKGISLCDWSKSIFSRMTPFNRYHNNYFYKLVLSLSTDAKYILDYGCGDGSESLIFQKKSYQVLGFDISESGIRKAYIKIKENKIKNISFSVMDCENLSFKDNVFDIIFGRGILHHIDIKKAFKEIIRVLKPNGYVVFLEPLGINPLFKYLRKLLPSIETKGEHPLVIDDFKLFRSLFINSTFKFFHLFSILSSILYKFNFYIKLFNKLHMIEEKIFLKITHLGFLAWTCLIILKNPKINNDLI